MMSKLLLLVIILIAFVLRIWELGIIPISPDWDEVNLGYNAYSIISTGKDEFGERLPLVLRSFGDFKPALYAYLIIPFIHFLDLTVVAVRAPSVIFGTITVIASFFLIKELLRNEKLAYLGSFLLAISPWHIQFSRVAFESNIGLAFNVLGLLFFLKGLRNKYFFIISPVFFSLSLYVYQSQKLFIPILFCVLLTLYWKEILLISKKYLVLAILIAVLFSSPIALVTFQNTESLSRAKNTSFLNNPVKILDEKHYQRNLLNETEGDYIGKVLDNRRVIYFKSIISNYLSHFEFNFLFLKGDRVGRHQPPNMGHLYLFELPFLLIGLYLLLFKNFAKKSKILIILWSLIVPIPASITWDVPNSVRILNILPMPQILIALGLIGVIEFFKSKMTILKKKLFYFGIFIIIIGYIFNFYYFYNQYFSQYNYFSASSWQYGYEQLIKYTEENKDKYSKVVISRIEPLDQSYAFFLFYMKYSPNEYQKVWNDKNYSKEIIKFDKYEFKNFNWHEEDKKNKLYVGSRKEIPDIANIRDIIYYPDGTEAIIIATEE